MMLTQLYDAGASAPRQMPHGWGWWHVSCLTDAVEVEGGEWKEAFDPGWTFREEHRYEDPADGEVFVLSPGDRFAWWWS